MARTNQKPEKSVGGTAPRKSLKLAGLVEEQEKSAPPSSSSPDESNFEDVEMNPPEQALHQVVRRTLFFPIHMANR